MKKSDLVPTQNVFGDWIKTARTEEEITRQIKGLEDAGEISMHEGFAKGYAHQEEISIQIDFIKKLNSYISVNEEDDEIQFDAEKKAYDWLYGNNNEDLWIRYGVKIK